MTDKTNPVDDVYWAERKRLEDEAQAKAARHDALDRQLSQLEQEFEFSTDLTKAEKLEVSGVYGGGFSLKNDRGNVSVHVVSEEFWVEFEPNTEGSYRRDSIAKTTSLAKVREAMVRTVLSRMTVNR